MSDGQRGDGIARCSLVPTSIGVAIVVDVTNRSAAQGFLSGALCSQIAAPYDGAVGSVEGGELASRDWSNRIRVGLVNKTSGDTLDGMAEAAWDVHKGEDGPEIIVGIADSGVKRFRFASGCAVPGSTGPGASIGAGGSRSVSDGSTSVTRRHHPTPIPAPSTRGLSA